MGMGGPSGGGGGGRRGRGRRSRGVMSEINITPMVDVMLVLLIIFMVAAPMMTSGVPIDLPRSAANALANDTKPVTVSVDPSGAISVGESPVQETDLVAAVTAEAANGTEDRIFVRGDTSSNYGAVMRVMGLLSAAGFTKIGLVTQSDQ